MNNPEDNEKKVGNNHIKNPVMLSYLAHFYPLFKGFSI